ncbi:MAG: hypothetical protein IT210_04625 [Armatimonadetes bacterium]|nr:hypothetical protein [Armatimonadota bacterium]
MSRCKAPVERLNGGQPVIVPTGNWWENGVTFNSAAVYLERSEENDPLIRRLLSLDSLDDPRLANGVVACHYRARPRKDPDFLWTRSFIGLAVFTPEMEPLCRYPEPVLSPSLQMMDFDQLGVEDPRITRLEESYYMVYCGVSEHEKEAFRAQLCLASSKDLLHWEKMGPCQGHINLSNNKDGVLLPQKINDKYVLFHRPMIGKSSDYSIEIALCDTLDGQWNNCGVVLSAYRNPAMNDSWVGAGSVPIPLDDGRYLTIYHTGNWLKNGLRQYDLDAAIFDFRNFSSHHPAAVVEKRLEPLMVPETEAEVKAPFSDSVANVLFICGSYEYQRYIYMLYGGGDTYTLAARIEKEALLDCLEKSDNANPYVSKGESSP